MAWAELRTMAAVGILCAGVDGARVSPPVSAGSSSTGEKPGMLAQDIVQRNIDFSDWPAEEDEGGCYSCYPDLEAHEYRIFIGCPNYLLENLIPGAFRDFVLDISVKDVRGNNVWYGPRIATNRQTIRERAYLFMISEDGMFLQQQVDYNASFIKTPMTRVLQSFPAGNGVQAENSRKLRMTRRGGRIEFAFNGVSLFEDEILLENQIVNIGIAVGTPPEFRGQAHVAFRSIDIQYPAERQRFPNLALLPSPAY